MAIIYEQALSDQLRQVNILPLKRECDSEVSVTFKTCVIRKHERDKPISFASIIDAIESKLTELNYDVTKQRIHLYYSETYVLPDGAKQSELYTWFTEAHMYKLKGAVDTLFYEVCATNGSNKFEECKDERIDDRLLTDKDDLHNELLWEIMEPFFACKIPGMCGFVRDP